MNERCIVIGSEKAWPLLSLSLSLSASVPPRKQCSFLAVSLHIPKMAGVLSQSDAPREFESRCNGAQTSRNCVSRRARMTERCVMRHAMCVYIYFIFFLPFFCPINGQGWGRIIGRTRPAKVISLISADDAKINAIHTNPLIIVALIVVTNERRYNKNKSRPVIDALLLIDTACAINAVFTRLPGKIS